MKSEKNLYKKNNFIIQLYNYSSFKLLEYMFGNLIMHCLVEILLASFLTKIIFLLFNSFIDQH